jgi:hypothetical protein
VSALKESLPERLRVIVDVCKDGWPDLYENGYREIASTCEEAAEVIDKDEADLSAWRKEAGAIKLIIRALEAERDAAITERDDARGLLRDVRWYLAEENVEMANVMLSIADASKDREYPDPVPYERLLAERDALRAKIAAVREWYDNALHYGCDHEENHCEAPTQFFHKYNRVHGLLERLGKALET